MTTKVAALCEERWRLKLQKESPAQLFSSGLCHLFAIHLQKEFPAQGIELYAIDSSSQPGVHVACYRGSIIWDSRGARKLSDFKAA